MLAEESGKHRMLYPKPFLPFASLATFALAPYASAAGITLAYQGVVDSPSGTDPDGAGLFGGGDLQGDAFSALVTYDTSRGEDGLGSDSDARSGGRAFLNQETGLYSLSPILSVTVKTAGHTYTFIPGYYSTLYTQAGPDGYVSQNAIDEEGDEASLQFSTALAPALLSRPFSSEGLGSGYLLTGYPAQGTGDELDLDLSHVDLAVSAAPEPDDWALLMAGVALCGLALQSTNSRCAGLGTRLKVRSMNLK